MKEKKIYEKKCTCNSGCYQSIKVYKQDKLMSRFAGKYRIQVILPKDLVPSCKDGNYYYDIYVNELPKENK